MIAGWTSLNTRGSLSVTFCSNAYWCEFFTRAVCLEEGYNIVAAHTQKPMPPTSESLKSIW